jgi:hypothetical protein
VVSRSDTTGLRPQKKKHPAGVPACTALDEAPQESTALAPLRGCESIRLFVRYQVHVSFKTFPLEVSGL